MLHQIDYETDINQDRGSASLQRAYIITSGAQPEFFQGRGGFVELGHFDKLFVKNTRKKGPAGKNVGAFPPTYS